MHLVSGTFFAAVSRSGDDQDEKTSLNWLDMGLRFERPFVFLRTMLDPGGKINKTVDLCFWLRAPTFLEKGFAQHVR